MGNKSTSKSIENSMDKQPTIDREPMMKYGSRSMETENFTVCHDQEKHDFMVKLVILGDCTVGKSCLCKVLSVDEFTDTYTSTIGLEFSAVTLISSSSTRYKVMLWDTTGDERYKNVVSSYYRATNLFIVMFDLSNKASFDHASTYLTDIQNHDCVTPNILLIGNKSDLANQVTPAHIKSSCFKDIEYIEISLKTRQGIPDLINKIGNLIQTRCKW